MKYTEDELIEQQKTTAESDEVVIDKPVINYDKSKIADEIGLDKESFDELFQDYTDESKNLISTLQTSINNNNPDNWKYSAVKLKGMSDNMRINNFTSELEVLINTNDKTDAQDTLNKIQVTLSQILSTKEFPFVNYLFE